MMTSFRIDGEWVLGRWVVAVKQPGSEERVWLDAHKMIEVHLGVAERRDDLSQVLAVVTAMVQAVTDRNEMSGW